MKKIFVIGILVTIVTGCKKYLDERPSKSLVVPSTLADLQSLLDFTSRVNFGESGALEASSDNYYLSDADWAAIPSEDERRIYTWEKDRLFVRVSNDYGFLYDNVYRTNTVLKGLEKIPRTATNASEWDNVYGQACFIRGRSFHNIAMLWALAYDEQNASTTLGIPLRLDPDFNVASTRASLKETYDRIEEDVLAAVRTLPVTTHPVRASRIAAYALAARLYMSMRNYNKMGAYADSAWQLNNKLLDYNTLTASANFPFKQFHAEVLYETQLTNWSIPFSVRIDSVLYNSYNVNDLRRSVFFTNNTNGSHGFKGSYSGSNAVFQGLATDEVLLMRAESFARGGLTAAAMQDLNALLIKRFKTGTFTPLAATSAADALQKILTERRKELVMRGLRWIDLKRLNKEAGFETTMTRKLNGLTYTLAPNDLRYALPFPESVIEKSGMTQNPR